MTRCSVVIPTYGNPTLTEACVAALQANPPTVDHEIVLVDDASPDGSADRLTRLRGVRLIRRTVNGGFAKACNDGARRAVGELVVFLNNDTIPQSGWLDALVQHHDRLPTPAVIGSRLLYPDGTVQHAGVVFGQDGHPHHVYAGFPGDHPAVLEPRRFQAVTGACLLVSRDRFLDLGGFDPSFRNGMEDVDFCLRARRAGCEIWYCPSSVAVHLESVTRGRRTREIRDGIQAFQDRWRGRVIADDLQVYAADGLLDVRYRDLYPIEIRIDPGLALPPQDRAQAIDRWLRYRSEQASDLLRDVVELSARVGLPNDAGIDPQNAGDGDLGPGEIDHEEISREIDDILAAIHRLQEKLAILNPATDRLPTSRVAYREQRHTIRTEVMARVPEGSTILVLSRGDAGLLDLGQRTAWHFPRTEEGEYAGHHPADSTEAVRRLEAGRQAGAEYLVMPAHSRWWLEHYPGFRAHLEASCEELLREDPCSIYSLFTEEAHAAVG